MSNDDKRRRQDGSTAKLSVAELLARREAETQPIPRITDDGAGDRSTGPSTDDEETVRFSAASLSAAAANLSGRELHVTELLRREGRAGEEERGTGFSVPKLVAMAGGGVVLAGTVAFTATNLLSSPDERPPAEVRFDARPAARATNTLTKDLGAAAAQQQAQAQQTQAETTTTTPEQTAQTTTQRAPRPVTQQQQQQTTTTTTTEQAPSTQAPSTSSSPETTTPPPSTSTTTPAPPSSSTQPPSSSTPPPSSSTPSTPPSSSTPSTPPSQDPGRGNGIGLGLDLGGILNPLGGFDFFAPAS